MYLKHKMTCLNLSQCLRTDRQISIYARMPEGSRSNNDTFDVLKCFVGPCRISVTMCMLIGDNNISRGAVAGSLICPHLVSFVKSRGQIVMFSEI